MLAAVVVLGGTAYGVVCLDLFVTYRALRLVRFEHREGPPARVWLCLIPVVGNVYALWLVWSVARVMRRQFTALGEHDSRDRYGAVAGTVCAAGPLLGLVTGAASFACLELWPEIMRTAAGPVFYFHITLGIVILAAFVVHCNAMEVCKRRLAKRFSLTRTQNEADYADDLPEPDRDD